MVKLSLKSLRHPKLRHRRWWQVISRPFTNRALWIPCRDTVATGMAIGLFFSLMMIPFQSLPAALLAMRAKANVPFAMAACWLSNPFTSGPIIFGQFALGHWLRNTLGVPMPHFLTNVQFHVEHVGTLNAASFILGMIVSGVIVALLAYPTVHLFSAIMPHHLPVRQRRASANLAAKSLRPPC